MSDFNMADLFGRMAEMQQRVADTQEALARETVDAEVGGGVVRVTADGRGRITAVKVAREALDLDEGPLFDPILFTAGFNYCVHEGSSP